MGLLIQLIEFLLSAFLAILTLVATVSIFVGLARFLLAAPGAILADLADRKRARARAEPPRTLRYVQNEAENDPPGLPPASLG